MCWVGSAGSGAVVGCDGLGVMGQVWWVGDVMGGGVGYIGSDILGRMCWVGCAGSGAVVGCDGMGVMD